MATVTNTDNTTFQPIAVLPPPPAPRVEDAYAIVFDALCMSVLPKTPEFQHFINEFVTQKKVLRDTTAGRAVYQSLQKDIAQPYTGNGPGPAFDQWKENKRRAQVFSDLMGVHMNDIHEPGQQPSVWPLAVAEDIAGTAEPKDDGSIGVADGESTATTEVETISLFRQTTPDDNRMRLPKALDWLVYGIPVHIPQSPGGSFGGWRRIPFPIAGIFRGWV